MTDLTDLNASIITSPDNQSCEAVSKTGLEVENVFSIITTVIVSIGTVLNALNIIITVARPFKGSLYVYLIALSVVDGLYCITVLPTRAFRCGKGCIDVPVEATIYEKYIYLPLGNTFATADIFITVFWAVHRLSNIYRPKIVTDNRLIPQIAVVISVITAFCLHVVIYLEYVYIDGQMVKTKFNLTDADLYYKTALMIVTKVFPILILLITSILLVRTINKAIQRRKRLIFQHTTHAKNIYQQTRINIILISVICMMIVGNTPVTLSHTEFAELMFRKKGCHLLADKSYRIFRALANTTAQLAFSSNFFVYYAMNRNFQDWIRQVFAKCCFSHDCTSQIKPQLRSHQHSRKRAHEPCHISSVMGSNIP